MRINFFETSIQYTLVLGNGKGILRFISHVASQLSIELSLECVWITKQGLAEVLGVDYKLVLIDLLHVTNKSRFFQKAQRMRLQVVRYIGSEMFWGVYRRFSVASKAVPSLMAYAAFREMKMKFIYSIDSKNTLIW